MDDEVTLNSLDKKIDLLDAKLIPWVDCVKDHEARLRAAEKGLIKSEVIFGLLFGGSFIGIVSLVATIWGK